MIIAKRWKLSQQSIVSTQLDMSSQYEALDTDAFLEVDERAIDDDTPRMFLTSRGDRVFTSAMSQDGSTSSHPDVRSNFEWPIPRPPPDRDYGLIVTPTAEQARTGCVCPGLRHNKRNPVCALNPRLLASKSARSSGHLALYTAAGDFARTLRITEEKAGPRRRIRLVTYKTQNV